MDALKFLKEFKRMISYENENDIEADFYITVKMKNNIFGEYSIGFDACKDTVFKVEKWSNEHPLKTRLQDFNEKYPNAHVGFDETPIICCSVLGYCEACEHTHNANCKSCWNEPV